MEPFNHGTLLPTLPTATRRLATRTAALLGCLSMAAGCSSDDDGGSGDALANLVVPSTYTFPDDAGTETAAWTGQTMRHLLISALKADIGAMTEEIDSGAFVPTAGDVEARLGFYVDFDSSTSGALPLPDMGVDALQATWDDVSSDKDLQGKIAGNDSVTDHKDWSSAFAVSAGEDAATPEGLVRRWIKELDDAAVARASGTIANGPDGQPLSKVYLLADGRDLQQLLQKHLLGAIALSQGLDDYLDDDLDGKGLLAEHVALSSGKPYTPREHAWDEAFGYFGAAVDHAEYSDDDTAGAGAGPRGDGSFDTDGDGKIDLVTEYVHGHAQNAGKRDRGAAASAATDFSGEAWQGLLRGRALLRATAGRELTDEEAAELTLQRNRVEGAWEGCSAATVVHYINATLQDMARFGTDDYDFATHAKHWSEAKGVAYGLQFSPRSPLSDTELQALLDALGAAPVLPDADAPTIAAYKESLRAARAALGAAYGFNAANLGDDAGENGW